MKKVVLLFFAGLIALSLNGQSPSKKKITVVVAGKGVEESTSKKVRTIFESALNTYTTNTYIVRLPWDESEYNERCKEISNENLSNDVKRENMKRFGNFSQADEILQVEFDKDDHGPYSIYAKIFEVETGDYVPGGIAFYRNTLVDFNQPEIYDFNDDATLQRACYMLIYRLNLYDNNDSVRTKLENYLEKKHKTKKTANNNAVNGSALAYSLIPGLGLMLKGHKGEGAAYMVGDLALVGGGVGMLAYAQKQERIMNSRNVDYDTYKQAEKNLPVAKTLSWSFFGAAAVLYGVNLIRAYCAKPTSRAELQCSFVPTPMEGRGHMDYGLAFAITYSF